MQLFRHRIYDHTRRRRRLPSPVVWLGLAVVVLGVISWWTWHPEHVPAKLRPILKAPAVVHPAPAAPTPRGGVVLGVDQTQTFTAAEATSLARQNYGAATPTITTGLTKISFHYRSVLPTGEDITVHGRAYLPETPGKRLPIFAFAPGTTGIGDECAASIEQPHKVNWGDYDSHMAAYASQGYAAVTTDYEGMRDSNRIHHYMIGQLEGRAVLDSIRALKNLPQAKDRLDDHIYLAGYSQGGHAAYWADKIDAEYAPELAITGVIGYGPVLSVKQTLADVTHAANINWFGPYVLYSYADYYHATYPLNDILLQHWVDTLATDVPGHCIDTDIPYWGHNPAGVYQPAFIAAMTSGDWSGPYASLSQDLDANAVGAVSTTSAKLINQGALDNVVLPAQAQAAFPGMCQASHGPVQLHLYPHATHYDTMVQSLPDTLAWMKQLTQGNRPASNCQ